MEYHKIQSVYKRDEQGKILDGQYTLPEFSYLEYNLWEWTEKVDGTNMRLIWKDGKLTLGGKTDNAQLPNQLVNTLHERFADTSPFSSTFDGDAVLYGEGYGPKIQNGGKYKSEQDFVLFDVNIAGIWLERHNVEDIGKKLGIQVVPLLKVGTLREAIYAVQRGLTSQWGNFEAEGLVVRPTCEMRTRRGDRIITKIKCKDFK